VPLDQLIGSVGGPAIVGDARVDVQGITQDSRRVRPGYLFAALKGDRSDGLRFVPDALARGASAVLSDRPRPEPLDCPWIQASDARAALAEIARSFYERPDETIPVIGVTGTNGKTTVSYLLEAIVRTAGGTAGLLGTVTYRIAGSPVGSGRTTPEADELFAYLRRMVDEGCSHAIVEVSSHALALKRVHAVRFAAGVFTNLTRDHLDFHGTMEEYFEAKSLLIRGLAPSAVAILNDDSPYAPRLASLTRARVVTFGSSARSTFRMGPVESSFEGVRFDLTVDGRTLPVVSPLPGLPNASNVAAALAAAISLGIDEQAALAGIRACAGAPGRFERITRGQDFHVIVDYAHTDDALARVLDAVRALEPARILTVFGCGGDRDRDKRPLMGEAAARRSDEVFLTSDNPRTEDPERIMDDAEKGIRMVPGGAERMRRITDRREAIAAAIALAEPGDAVVIAGKGHEDYQILGERTIPFDDRQVAIECLDLRLGRG
jgi:UDP-N-acetylmuramoyl-L-alanyl-D-glutamate--2,6-diaminopimelate ligase